MIRAALATLAALAAAATAAAATGVHWSVLQQGRTTSNGAQQPTAYIAVTKAQEQRFLGRISSSNQPALENVNFQRKGLIAVFLDGAPCISNVTVNGVSRTKTTVTVVLHYTRPPVGVAMCVRMDTQYVVLSATRATLGNPVPTHVRVVAIART